MRDIFPPRFVLIGIGVSWFFCRLDGRIYDHCRCSRCTNCNYCIGKRLHAGDWMSLVFQPVGCCQPLCRVSPASSERSDDRIAGLEMPDATSRFRISLVRISCLPIILDGFRFFTQHRFVDLGASIITRWSRSRAARINRWGAESRRC